MEIGVGIQEGYSLDKGKAVARLDKESMKQMEISNGQIIEIQGNRKTFAKCFQKIFQNFQNENGKKKKKTKQKKGKIKVWRGTKL